MDERRLKALTGALAQLSPYIVDDDALSSDAPSTSVYEDVEEGGAAEAGSTSNALDHLSAYMSGLAAKDSSGGAVSIVAALKQRMETDAAEEAAAAAKADDGSTSSAFGHLHAHMREVAAKDSAGAAVSIVAALKKRMEADSSSTDTAAAAGAADAVKSSNPAFDHLMSYMGELA